MIQISRFKTSAEPINTFANVGSEDRVEIQQLIRNFRFIFISHWLVITAWILCYKGGGNWGEEETEASRDGWGERIA